MGLFDSVAGTFFNTATSAYKTVVQPVVSTATQAVQTVTKPVVQGSYSTGATQQVAVQPKPPIVTSVANQNTLPAQQALAQSSGSKVITTQQVTPQGETIYVSARPSPVQPEPVIISKPVQVQAPSIVDVTGALIPGAGLALAARTISGDPQVIQNAAMDITGLRQVAIQNQQASLQARNEALIARNEALTQTSLNQRAALEQQVIGFEQKKQQLQERINLFESLGPATSIGEYNTRLNEYNLLTSEISALNLEGERINAEAVAANRNLIREQIGILNTRDQLRAEGVALNIQAANIGTTGLAGLTAGFDLRVNKPISDIALTKIGEPFGLSKEDVALGLQLNRQVSEGMVTFGGPSIQNLAAAYGAGMITDTLMKPGEAIFWTGVGIATGGVTRALAPGMEAAVAASRVTGASFGTRALGAGIQAAPIVMGGLFAGSVGLDVASQKTPGAMVSRFGGLTATEILPMVGGAVIGYNAPEIWRGIQTRDLPIGFKTEFVPTDEPPFKRLSRGTPQEYKLIEKPVIDLTEAKFTFEPQTKIATPAERRMVIEQYGLSQDEILYLKTPGTTLNDLLSLRTQVKPQKPEVMVVPQEELPILRADLDVFELPVQATAQKTRPITALQPTRQEVMLGIELQHFQETGTLLGINEKIRLDNIVGMSLASGVLSTSLQETVTQQNQRQILYPGLALSGLSASETKQEQDRLILAGIALSPLQATTPALSEISLQSVRPIQVQGTNQATTTMLDLIGLQGTQLITTQINPPIETTLLVPGVTTTILKPPAPAIVPPSISITDYIYEVPPYTPPEFTFEIPPIPPIIIPGFPVAGGGGGGGGGFGGQGGFLFEESWLAGGNEDPFGVGKMNFDVGTLSGVSTGTTGRKRRRR